MECAIHSTIVQRKCFKMKLVKFIFMGDSSVFFRLVLRTISTERHDHRGEPISVMVLAARLHQSYWKNTSSSWAHLHAPPALHGAVDAERVWAGEWAPA